jgi:hypothetical protein
VTAWGVRVYDEGILFFWVDGGPLAPLLMGGVSFRGARRGRGRRAVKAYGLFPARVGSIRGTRTRPSLLTLDATPLIYALVNAVKELSAPVAALEGKIGERVVISVALQHGIPAAALAKSIARIPENLEGPAIKPASPIGAALDLLVDFEASQNG